MASPDTFLKIAAEFELLDGWEERYRYIIELGQLLPGVLESEKTEANRVHGCMSYVWLVSEIELHGGASRINYRAESDASIVNGLLAILLAILDGKAATNVSDTEIQAAFDKLGFSQHLSAQRSNGLLAVIRHIRAGK